jgi:hypothetical protein
MLDKAKQKFEQMKKLKAMRSQMKSVEKELVLLNFEGTSKGSSVKVIMDGKMNVKSVDVSQDLLDKKDKKLIEKSLQEAFNNAFTAAQKGASEKMKEMGGIPGFDM